MGMAIKKLAKQQKDTIENEAINAIMKAAGRSSQSLKEEHLKIWKSLWTTGFGISHSMADEAVNGAKVNATIYLSCHKHRLHFIQFIQLM